MDYIFDYKFDEKNNSFVIESDMEELIEIQTLLNEGFFDTAASKFTSMIKSIYKSLRSNNPQDVVKASKKYKREYERIDPIKTKKEVISSMANFSDYDESELANAYTVIWRALTTGAVATVLWKVVAATKQVFDRQEMLKQGVKVADPLNAPYAGLPTFRVPGAEAPIANLEAELNKLMRNKEIRERIKPIFSSMVLLSIVFLLYATFEAVRKKRSLIDVANNIAKDIRDVIITNKETPLRAIVFTYGTLLVMFLGVFTKTGMAIQTAIPGLTQEYAVKIFFTYATLVIGTTFYAIGRTILNAIENAKTWSEEFE